MVVIRANEIHQHETMGMTNVLKPSYGASERKVPQYSLEDVEFSYTFSPSQNFPFHHIVSSLDSCNSGRSVHHPTIAPPPASF